jgi:hypothetical protein
MRKTAKKPTKRRAPESKLGRSVTTRSSPAAVAKPETGERKASASKQARVIALLRSSSGVTMAAMVRETGWQPHSVRGFLAGVVRKKMPSSTIEPIDRSTDDWATTAWAMDCGSLMALMPL